MKRFKAFTCMVVMCLMALTFAACDMKGNEEKKDELDYCKDVTENEITFYSDGSILEIAVVDMSDLKDTADLSDYVKTQVAGFNKAAGVDKISLLQFKEEGKTFKTAIKYSDLETFNKFNGCDFNLSIYKSQDLDAITGTAATLTDATNGKTVGSAEIKSESLMMLTFDKKYLVKAEGGKILYTAHGAEKYGDGALYNETEDLAVVLFEFK